MSRAEDEFALAEQHVNTLCWLASTSKNYDNEAGRIH
jgi:hypothetical protein